MGEFSILLLGLIRSIIQRLCCVRAEGTVKQEGNVEKTFEKQSDKFNSTESVSVSTYDEDDSSGSYEYTYCTKKGVGRRHSVL